MNRLVAAPRTENSPMIPSFTLYRRLLQPITLNAGSQRTQEGAVSTATQDNFSDRMRERMPAHRLWHGQGTVPGMSKTANDMLWDEMRARLRTVDLGRNGVRRENPLIIVVERMKSPMGVPIVGAAVVGAGIVAYTILH